MSTADEDFYEDDEPLEDIVKAFERGERRVTRRPERTTATTPARGKTASLDVPGLKVQAPKRSSTKSPNKATRELVDH